MAPIPTVRASPKFGAVDAESIHILNAESIHTSQLQQHEPFPSQPAAAATGWGLHHGPSHGTEGGSKLRLMEMGNCDPGATWPGVPKLGTRFLSPPVWQ